MPNRIRGVTEKQQKQTPEMKNKVVTYFWTRYLPLFRLLDNIRSTAAHHYCLLRKKTHNAENPLTVGVSI